MCSQRAIRHIAADDREVLLHAILAELRDHSGLIDLLNRADGTGLNAAVFHSDAYIALWRLQDDLGWHLRDPRDLFPLTLPDRHLAVAMTWMAFATETRARLYGSQPADERTRQVCGELLGLLPHNLPVGKPLGSRRLWAEPTPPPTIDRGERDLLRHVIVSDLNRLPAIAKAIERCGDDPRPALLLRYRYEAEFSLLHDLGFAPTTNETIFSLRSHAEVLEVALRHFAAITLETALWVARDGDDRERAAVVELKRCGALCDRLLRELPTTDGWGRRP